MAFTAHTGHGGIVTVGGAQFDGVTEWRLQKTSVIAETTNAASGGWQTFKKVVKGGTWTINFVWDSTIIPDTDVTLDEGDEVTLVLTLGDSTKTYSVPAIVETLEIVDNAVSDVIRGTASGRVNGAITDPVT